MGNNSNIFLVNFKNSNNYILDNMVNNELETIAEVEEFFREFVEAYPKDDLEKYLSFWAKDSNLVVFGTGEKWVGYEEEYRYAPAKEKERFDEIAMICTWLKVNSHGSVAWLAAEVIVEAQVGDQRFSSPARITSVVKKTDSKWAIVQGHISIAPSQ